MGRRRTVDREQLLDAAETIIEASGAAGLTIDAVARAVGITKGGVQYCFGNKDALIDALFERWGAAYDRIFAEVAAGSADPLDAVRAHVAATRRTDEVSAKSASLLAALAQTPEHLASTRLWYRQRIAGLDLSTPAGRRARLAFLATEGAFMLRFFGFMDIDEAEWQAIFDDLQTLL
ncbi:TetR/AcrR family transcriptional regulator [Bordetella petrii]|uniref:TetR/AcrR family transcriptional regulator n=1 Tax=Bordetella petrii TaxID=94624 RepID=UPI001A977D4D|nr:TetR/AcrR family transcriptional regulator [Bordetella petrii]MBO1112726.1 TetR family transcriptional regulator [Bordetella petrii]